MNSKMQNKQNQLIERITDQHPVVGGHTRKTTRYCEGGIAKIWPTVSLIAEFISMKFFNIRFWLSGLIHIGFGLGTYFIEPGFSIPAIICSIIFFALDEITKKNSPSSSTNLPR